MRRPHPLPVSAALLLLGFLSAASATVLEIEPFNYPANLGASVNTLNGGTGWSTNAWSDSDTDVTLASTNTSLSYPSNVILTPTGSRLALTLDDSLAQATRALGTGMNLGTSNQTFFSSALFNRSAVTGELALVNFIDNSSNLRWRYGIDDNGNGIVTVNPSDSNQVATTSFTLAANTTYLIVSKFRTNTGTGGIDEVFLKVFSPTDTVAEPLTDGDWDISTNGNSSVTLANVRLDFSNAAGQTNQFDELRIGTTFADVAAIPEPTSALLALCGGAGLLLRRRRH